MRALIAVGLLVAAGLAGCSTSSSDDVVIVDEPLASAPLASYLRNLSQPIPGLSVETGILEHLRLPSPEGLLLDTWIVRPDVAEPVPLVLEVTPYFGGGDPRLPGLQALGRWAEELVSRGYAVGISSVRGTGNSEGCFTMGGPTEAQDTAAVLEALAAQPWSNGNIGLMGVSYPGTTPQDVWVEAPPSLKTIVPISGISDLYKYNFVNGVPIMAQGFAFNAYYWVMVGLAPAGLSGGAQAADPVSVPGAVIGEACTEQVEVQEGGFSSALDGNKDAYWQARDFLAELDASPDKQRASVFYIHGLQDWNVKPHHMEDWLPAVQATGVPYKVWLGQWGHNWPAPTGNQCRASDGVSACRADWWTETMVAWFDQFLKGIDTGILDAPAVQVQDDAGVWRHETHWPPETEPLRFGLTADALVEGTGEGTVAYHDRNGGLVPRQASQGTTQIVWTSAPVEEDLHVSGLPVFHADVTAEGRKASLILTLREELPDGTVRSINFGMQSLNHVRSLEAGDPDIAGKRQTVEFAFFPQDDVIHAGSRIVLVADGNIVGGPGPAVRPVADGGRITLHLEDAWLELPIDRTLVVEDPQPYAP
jgi:X-Pro dipeptidyl-peptidase